MSTAPSIFLKPPCKTSDKSPTKCAFIKDQSTKEILKPNKSGNVVYFSNAFQSESNDNNVCSIKEYNEEKMSLEEFVVKAHQYIQDGQLSLRQYKRCIVSILWQLATIAHTLQNLNPCLVQNNLIWKVTLLLCCAFFVYVTAFEVKICPKAVTLYGINFSHNQNVYISVTIQRISACEVCTQMSDFAILSYYCFIGGYPYEAAEVQNNNHELEIGSCLWAITQGKLKQYLGMDNKLKFVNSKILSLLNGLITLLNINPTERLNAADILNHRLFARFNGWIRG
eukprot:65922_1